MHADHGRQIVQSDSSLSAAHGRLERDRMSPKVISLLSHTSLFGGLKSDDVVACAHAFTEKHLEKGQTLFLRGDPGTHLYLVEAARISFAISTSNGRKLSF